MVPVGLPSDTDEVDASVRSRLGFADKLAPMTTFWHERAMSSSDPFPRGSLSAIEEFQRRSQVDLVLARDAFDQFSTVRRALDDMDGAFGSVLRQINSEPWREAVEAATRRFNDPDMMRATWQAVEEANRQRDLMIETSLSTKLFLERQFALDAFDTSISSAVEQMARTSEAIASAFAASHAFDNIAALASSAVAQMTQFQGIDFGVGGGVAAEIAERFARAREAAEALEQADTPEEQAARFMVLLQTVADALRGLVANTRKDVMAVSLFVLFGFFADIKTLLPSHAPPALTQQQASDIAETHRELDHLVEAFDSYRQTEHKLDEAYVADLPRAELKQPAMIRETPGRNGRALFKAPQDTLLAVVRTEGSWKVVVYRDPLTDRLAQGWVWGRAVRVLDTP
jgi:hypothetical protein